MNRGRTISLSLPPFTRWVKRLILTYAAIYLLMAVMRLASPFAREWVVVYLGLIPKLVMQGMIWQLISYSFLHLELLHFLFNALALWMFGSQLESDWGSKRFLEFYFFCTVAAALTTVAVSYTHILGLSPATPTIGETGGVNNFAHLGGLLFGYLYLKFLPRKGLMFATSERYFSFRNEYYRWKRRRAAKKFEVYMSKHDRKVEFDEHGNYIPPDDGPRKGNGGSKSGWVN